MNTIAKQQKETYQLQKILNETILPYKIVAADYGIELEIMDDLATYVTIVGNISTHRQLMDMILKNTIKFSKASKIIFSTRLLLQSQKELLLEFSIADNGINSKRNTRSFTYYRSLVLAKLLIEELGGKSELIAVPGVNTTLRFIIKYQWQQTPVRKLANELAFCNKNLEGKKVLLAEDNEINQKTIGKILDKEGMCVDIVNNGKEAIDLFEKNTGNYDVLILDLQMPYMDGLEATNYIRKKLNNTVPIIVLTVGADKDGYLKYFELGVNRLLRKPFTPKDLLETVQKLISPVAKKEAHISCGILQ